MYEGDSEANLNSGVEDYWLWNAGESDAKATSEGWFWHSGETVKSAETLFQMYLETVGRNSTLILNFPPNQAGVLPQQDVTVMESLGNLLTTRLGTDYAQNSSTTVTASAERQAGANRTYAATNVCDGKTDTYWATDDGVTSASLTFDLGETKTLHYVALQEYIRKGQRVKAFSIQYSQNGNSWTTVSGTQTTIGYKRIIPLNSRTGTSSYGSGVSARYVKVSITSSKACPLLHTVSIY